MKTSSTSLRDTRFVNDRLARLGIELMTLSELKRRTSTHQRAKPERVDFYMLWLTTNGFSHHMVDFVDFDISPQSMVFAKPGQVQQWFVEKDMAGWILLIEPTALLPAQGQQVNRDMLMSLLEDCPAVAHFDDQFNTDIESQIDNLYRDFNNFNESELDIALIQNAVLSLLLRLARWHSERQKLTVPQIANHRVFQLLRQKIEATFSKQWRVSQYARHLGYSESTLNRACEIATGQSLKTLIDRRLALEASRLLIHTNASIAEVGHQLGFSETTNFVRFFARMVGDTPARFRSEKLSSSA